MESALVRQAQTLFGEQFTRQAQSPGCAADARSPAAPDGKPASPPDGAPDQDAGELPDELPQLVKLQLTVRQEHRLWRHVETIEGFWESLQEIEPGAVARLAALATERRWEVIFLTKRPDSAGATTQMQTQRWLLSKGFSFPSVYVVRGSRGRVAAALGLDFVVDDRPDHCLDVALESKSRAILVWRDDESRLPAATRRLGIGVVGSVNECLDILTEIDSLPQERSSVIDRVMRLLGLKDERARS